MLVVFGDRRYTHEPFVGHGPHRIQTVLHGKVDIACPRQLALPSAAVSFVLSPLQAFNDQILRVVIPSSARAKLREYAAFMEQPQPLVMRLVMLASINPVHVAVLEVCLANQSQQWDLVEDRVDPFSRNRNGDVAQLVVLTDVKYGCKEELKVARRVKPKPR